MVVTANYGARVTAVRSADLTNPDEWDVIDPRTGTSTSEETSKEMASLAAELMHHEDPRVRRVAASALTQAVDSPWVDPDDAPEWTDEQFAAAKVHPGTT
jgi:predicted Zn-dependent protease